MKNAFITKEVEIEEEVTINSDSEDLFKLPGVECNLFYLYYILLDDYNNESINKPYFREEENNWGLE